MAKKNEIEELFDNLKEVVNNALVDLREGMTEFAENLEATKKIWIKDEPAKPAAKKAPATKKNAEKVTPIRKKKD